VGAGPFYQAADSSAWTVRSATVPQPDPAAGLLDDTLMRVLYGFDALVILSGSTPQTDLP
jgi:hypothetical protein